jgi:hypothetical protein
MKAARKITAGAALAAGALLLAAAGCKNDTPSAPELSGTVSVSGKAQVGETLTAVASLGGNGAVSYQWARGAADIPGETRETYTLTEDDEGAAVWVRASRAGYAHSIRSEPTAVAATPKEFGGIEALQAYLAGHSGGTDSNAPRPVKLSVDLSAADTMTSLFAALKTAGKYVSLDLSDCTGLSAWARYTGAGAKKIVSLVLPDSVTAIAAGTSGEQTFASFTSLKTLEASGVQTIGDWAFYQSATLETASLPTAKGVGTQAFGQCPVLASVHLPSATTINGSAFYQSPALKTVNLPAAATIGANAFQDCTALETVNLPMAVTIYAAAFSGCPALTSVSLPLATTIGTKAFLSCTALETVSLPKVTTVSNTVFSTCYALKTASLPAVTAIEQVAFYKCYALESLTLGEALPTLGANVFKEAGRDSGGFTVYVPTDEAKDALDAAIEDASNSWYTALKVPANMGEGKFNGVAVKG